MARHPVKRPPREDVFAPAPDDLFDPVAPENLVCFASRDSIKCVNPLACQRESTCVYRRVEDAPRTPTPSHGDEERLDAVASVVSFARRGGGNKRRKLRGTAAAERTRALVSARSRIESGDWKTVTASELVALFALVHEDVYGVADAQLASTGKEWALATIGVARLRDEEFSGDGARVVEYLRWFGAREGERERWRRVNGKGGSPCGWRLVFSRRLLTDYRIDQARRAT